MRRKLAALAAALALCATLAVADDATKPGKAKVEGASLSVYRKLDNKNFPYSGASTSLSIQVTYPGKQLLAVDASSKVSEFADDKGTSLMSTGFFKTSFSTAPMIGKDRTSMVVSVQSNVSPAKGATKLNLKGDLVLVCGLEEKSTEEKEVAMKEKAEAKIGDFTLKVNQEKGFGGAGASFTLTASRPVIKSITVKDADGKTVETTTFGNYGFGKTWTYNYSLRKVVEKPKVTITYFSKEEQVTLPINLSLGVGL
jgi:hypothetical protein